MIQVLLQYYPVSIEYIEKRNRSFDTDDWGSLSRNYRINWTEDLILKFEEKWCWYSFSYNPSLPWSKDFYEKYKNKFDYNRLQLIGVLPWSGTVIPRNEYIEMENLDKLSHQGIHHKVPPMSSDKFREIAERRGYPAISKASIGWSEEILNNFNLYWSDLSKNKSLPWSESLIEKFSHKWDWGALSLNKYLPWSKTFIEKYQDKFKLLDLASNSGLAANGIFINFEEILGNPNSQTFVPATYKYEPKDSWNRNTFDLWPYLSSCPSLNWSENLLIEHCDKWDWENISDNKSMPWSKKLIDRFNDKIVWSNLSNRLIELEKTELIEFYEDRIDWHYVSSNPKISPNLLKKFAHRWDWRELAFFNEGIIWTDDLIKYFMENYHSIKKRMVPIEDDFFS